jgi:hypothetical protein
MDILTVMLLKEKADEKFPSTLWQLGIKQHDKQHRCAANEAWGDFSFSENGDRTMRNTLEA